MSPRKFYKTVIEVVVLSERPYGPKRLSDVAYDIMDGDCVGGWDATESKEIDGRAAADLLYEFGSEPGFFQLDDEGNDVDGEDDDDGA